MNPTDNFVEEDKEKCTSQDIESPPLVLVVALVRHRSLGDNHYPQKRLSAHNVCTYLMIGKGQIAPKDHIEAKKDLRATLSV